MNGTVFNIGVTDCGFTMAELVKHHPSGDRAVVSEKKLHKLNATDIAGLLRAGKVQFVVANLGSPLNWVPVDECYSFWKSEVKIHLAAPAAKNYYLEDFPGEYFYFASEWEAKDGEPIVLLEMYH